MSNMATAFFLLFDAVAAVETDKASAAEAAAIFVAAASSAAADAVTPALIFM